MRRAPTPLLFGIWLLLLSLPLLDSGGTPSRGEGEREGPCKQEQSIFLERFVRLQASTLPGPEEATNQADKASGQEGWHGTDELDELPHPLAQLHSLFVFPERAARLGIRKALVLAEIDLDVEGRIVACRIVSAAGNGFEDEVLAKLPSVRFTPGKKNGRPVAVRARLPVRFVLKNGR